MSEKQITEKKETVFFVNPGYDTCPGDRIAPIFEEVFDEQLKQKVIKKTGEFDIYEEIQMSSNGSEIMMLKRQAKVSGVAIENDPNLVGGMNQSLYPSNIHEAMKYSSNINAAFSKLPEEIRKEVFANDPTKYLKAVQDGSAVNVIGTYYSNKAAVAESPAASGGEE